MPQQDIAHNRAGTYIRQLTGCRAFIPNPLPPDPPLRLDGELLALLSVADQSLGQLEGMSSVVLNPSVLPNPDLFTSMYVRKEAVLSSQIEGTIATVANVLEYEANLGHSKLPEDVLETYNYVKALQSGLKRLDDLPLCNRLLREIHGVLMQGVRGQEKTPGEFRTSQNWIGQPGSRLETASYVPPPPHEMNQAMGDLELYLNSDSRTPILIKAGLAHGQFEMIHPFLDGNGRLGRLLITFLLHCHKVLTRPFLYLSQYIRRHQDEYYARLHAISNDGDWEGWLKYFLKGVAEVSQEATDTTRKLIKMREEHRQSVIDLVRGRQNGLMLLDSLFENPMLSINQIRDYLGVSYSTASNLANDLVKVGILEEITQGSRNKVFVYGPYMDILQEN